MPLTAYADESYDLRIGVYILTASLVDLTETEDTRDTLRGLRTGAGKLHWYKADQQRRLHLAKVVGALDLTHVSVVGRALPLHAERARRKCMEVLLPELERAVADLVIFESRQARNNKHDIDMVDACRQQKLIKHRLHVTFVLPESEPLSWLPDVASEATLASQRGTDGYLSQFGAAMRVLYTKAK